MSKVYKILDCTTSDSYIKSFKNALIEKYGSNVSILYSDSNMLIFNCSQISNKVIKITNHCSYYGTSFTPTNTISNETMFIGVASTLYVYTSSQIILADNFIYCISSYDNKKNYNMIIGKTSGGKYIIHGSFNGDTTSVVAISNDVTNDTSKPIEFVGYDCNVMCDVNIPYKSTLMLYYPNDTSGDTLLRKSDDSIDTIDDIFITTYRGGNDYMLANSNALYSNNNVYVNGLSYKKMPTKLMVEI